jgi:hypothetical protein
VVAGIRDVRSIIKTIEGERMSTLGTAALECSAVIFDPMCEKVLFTRRTDDGRWYLPSGEGGRMCGRNLQPGRLGRYELTGADRLVAGCV